MCPKAAFWTQLSIHNENAFTMQIEMITIIISCVLNLPSQKCRTSKMFVQIFLGKTKTCIYFFPYCLLASES